MPSLHICVSRGSRSVPSRRNSPSIPLIFFLSAPALTPAPNAAGPSRCSSTISRRENAPVTTLTLDDRGKWGFTGKQGPEASGNRTSVFQVGVPRCLGWRLPASTRQAPPGTSLHAAAPTPQAPGYLCHTIDREEEKGSVLLIVVYGVPVAPGRCRLLNRQVRTSHPMPPAALSPSPPMRLCGDVW